MTPIRGLEPDGGRRELPEFSLTNCCAPKLIGGLQPFRAPRCGAGFRERGPQRPRSAAKPLDLFTRRIAKHCATLPIAGLPKQQRQFDTVASDISSPLA